MNFGPINMSKSWIESENNIKVLKMSYQDNFYKKKSLIIISREFHPISF